MTYIRYYTSAGSTLRLRHRLPAWFIALQCLEENKKNPGYLFRGRLWRSLWYWSHPLSADACILVTMNVYYARLNSNEPCKTFVPNPGIPGRCQSVGHSPGFADLFVTSPPRHWEDRRKCRHDGVLGPEKVKHRRTRSGCFMCRTRRIKVPSTLHADKPDTDF